MTDRSPSRATFIAEYVTSRLGDLHVCLPGTVENFDASKQTCDVKPQIKQRLRSESGEVTYESLPVIRNVPVVYFRAGGFYWYAPLEKGDNVVLHFTDYSLDEWFEQGRESSPSFAHSHELTDCFAVPGGYPKPLALSGVGTSDAVIGKENGSSIVLKSNGEIHAGQGTPSEFVALATKTLNRLAAIVSGFNSHTHTVSTTGGPTAQSGTTAPPSSPLSSPASVAADKLKASG